MKLIRTITEEDFNRQANPATWASFKERPGARAVMINENSEIALMHVSNLNYYKLPGGGVDEGESFEQALRRELREEAGVSDIEILAEIGEIDEIREEVKQKSIHYCYLVRLNGALNEPNRTDKEIKDGYQVIWAQDLNDAIRLVESGTPPSYGPPFERLRELSFLRSIKDSDLLGSI
jgi:8-oxo-dGTP diphosphatase